MDLVLFGIQGSGKGTQARKLAEEFNYSIFETGAELRKIAASGTELGNTVKSYIDQGKLAPIDIVMEVVKQAILERDPDQKILFDGIPRDVNQMESFNTIMHDLGRTFRCVQLTLDDDTAFKRIQGRAMLEGRTDDADENTIRRRMNIFKEHTLPVIEAYRKEGNMIDIDGGKTIDDVYADLQKAVTKIG